MEETRNHRRFINIAHFIDHYVLLVFPTVVIGLETALARSYAELIALSTACFVAFGLFSLPWGWLADHWSRRKIMAIFFFGCAVSMAAAAAAPNVYWLGAALLLLGIFAAIYHPVGIPMLVSVARDRGRDFATNGVWGNFGVALAPGITAALMATVGWRAAFVIPAVVCGAIGTAYLYLTAEEKDKAGQRTKVAEVPLKGGMMVAVFSFFALLAFTGGTVFNILTIAIPKIVDERMTQNVPLILLGSVATGVLLFGGVAQLTVGRLVSRYAPHILLAGIGVMPRYTADAWRGRVFAVRFFLAFITSGLAVSLIAALHGKGGFDLVLIVTSIVAVLFAFATIAISVLANRAESQLSAQPAE
jgi:MFS family permease